MTKVFLTGVYFLYKIKGVHEEVISILNVNENKNKYKGRFSTTSSFLFGYKNKRFLNNEVVSSSILKPYIYTNKKNPIKVNV